MAEGAQASPSKGKQPVCIIVLGMAGSGKTSWVQRMTAHLHAKDNKPYVINLDPACHAVPYPANIDIRDTVKYKEVMKEYSLGPNGAIMTSLNLFVTKFDEVTKIISSHSAETEYIILDTPGQIEVFTWSASGTIISETLASTFPTIVVYVIDIVRSKAPVTFMSNMLYACSILYKCKLPFVVALNKTDVTDHKFALEWMTNFESFEAALQKEESYSSNLAQTMVSVLDQFYANLKAVGVSAATGSGIEEFFAAVDEAKEEYMTDYLPQYERLKAEREKAGASSREDQTTKSSKDLSIRERVTNMLFADVKSSPKNKSVSIGLGNDEEEEASEEENIQMEEEEDEEERREYEAFKKEFLSK